MNLESEDAIERFRLLAKVHQLNGHLAINFVREVIALRYHSVFMPLRDINGHGLVLRGEPLLPLGINHYALSV